MKADCNAASYLREVELLRSQRLFFRRIEEHDLPRMLGWINDYEIFSVMGVWGPRTARAQEQWYDSVHNSNTNIIFAICCVDGGSHIGNTSIFDIDYRNSNAGITIMLPDLINRGRGYGREAIQLLCDYAFSYLNLHRLYCKTDNPAAERLYSSIGFVKEGVLRQQAYYDGSYVDKTCFGLLREEHWGRERKCTQVGSRDEEK